jgi:hypothetical protein
MRDNHIQRREKENSFFARLQKEALEELQLLSGKIWTDYNLHDPGVTIAEVLHYALYEMQYQLHLPFETYLSSEGKIDFEKLGLFSKEELTKPSIVTTIDYEELIEQNIPEVVNCKVCLNKNHKYEINIELAENADAETTMKEVEKLYHAHRNLCETLEKVVVTEKVEKDRRSTKNAQYIPEFYTDAKPFDVKAHFPPEYHSIQNQFPDNYGVNEKGMPARISKEHKAKIMQLKAYLLIYDHLLANTLHQVFHVNKLLELSAGNIPPYQANFSVSKMDKIMDYNRFEANKLQDRHFLESQKSHLLDFWDTIYGEDTKLFFLHEENLEQQNKKRIELIKILPQLNVNRFRSCNILDENAKNDCPLKQLISILLGYENREEIPVETVLSTYNLRLTGDQDFFQNYDNLDTEHIIRYLESKSFSCLFESIPETHLIFKKEMFEELEKNLSFFWYNLLFESLLEHGIALENYRIIHNAETNTFLLVFMLPNSEKWVNLGFSADKSLLVRLANLLKNFLKSLKHNAENIYLLEHILFDPDAENFNKLTIVISELSEADNDREKYETLICERIPAHLDVDFLWLEPHQMYDFEQNYHLWKQETKTGNNE